MSSFAFLKPRNGMWRDAKIAKVKSQILDKITALPVEVRKDKMSMELILLVCQAVEHSIDNTGKKHKIDKKMLVVDILNSLFAGLTGAELNTISSHIEYLHDNGQIYKYPFWKVATACIVDWVKKKFV
jgi:hypothetical protein